MIFKPSYVVIGNTTASYSHGNLFSSFFQTSLILWILTNLLYKCVLCKLFPNRWMTWNASLVRIKTFIWPYQELLSHKQKKMTVICPSQRRKSVVKYGGQDQSGQAIKLFRAPRKIRFTFHFWQKSFILDDVELAALSDNSFEEKMWHFRKSKHTLTPVTYFRGSRPPNFRIYAPNPYEKICTML